MELSNRPQSLGEAGGVMIEVLCVLVWLSLVFSFHLKVIRHWRGELQRLQGDRISYDGGFR